MASSASEPAPVVGVTSYLEQARTGVWDVRASFLPQGYLDALAAGGAVPLVLAPQEGAAAVDGMLDRLDGLVLAGGADVDPRRYGARPHPATGAPREDRDAFEIALVHGALERGMPLLGICRGAQILNVALGGTLHQHLPDIVGSARYQPGPAVFGSETVEVEAGSRLAGAVGARLTVPVYHHQAIDRLGEGLTVCARSRDGVVEAVELPGGAFVLAVQWHPEEDASDRRLFAAFTEAARAWRAASSLSGGSRNPEEGGPRPAGRLRPSASESESAP